MMKLMCMLLMIKKKFLFSSLPPVMRNNMIPIVHPIERYENINSL